MNKITLNKFVKYLQEVYTIYAPVKDGKELYVKTIHGFEEIDFSNQIPINTFKPVLLPKRESLFEIKKGKLVEPKIQYTPECAFLMSVMDIKTVW